MGSSRDFEGWMWERAVQMLDEAERLRRQFFGVGPFQGDRSSWVPPVDIFETEEEVIVLVALPGVLRERLDVSLEGHRLTIRGERSIPSPMRGAFLHRVEIPHGSFERTIDLPSCRYEPEPPELADGCLALRFRKDADR